MRTNDFENAVEALGCGISVSHIILGRDRQVTTCYGERGLTVYMWDATGRGFTSRRPSADDVVIDDIDLPLLRYERDAAFDLKFD